MYKLKKLLLLIGLLVVLSSCVNDEPAITKIEDAKISPSEEPELIEEVNEETVDEYIEFVLEDEVVRINLSLVPILKQYLSAENEREKMVESMHLERIHQQEDNSIYLLRFSCMKELCSYLLLDQSKDNSGHLLTDFAILKDIKESPEQKKLLFHFNRITSDAPLPISRIVTIDLDTWEPLSPINETDHSINNDYNWPIFAAEWIDETRISVTLPDIPQADEKSFTEWVNNGQSKTTHMILSTKIETE